VAILDIIIILNCRVTVSLLESWSTQTLLLGSKKSNQALCNHFYSRQCLLDQSCPQYSLYRRRSTQSLSPKIDNLLSTALSPFSSNLGNALVNFRRPLKIRLAIPLRSEAWTHHEINELSPSDSVFCECENSVQCVSSALEYVVYPRCFWSTCYSRSRCCALHYKASFRKIDWASPLVTLFWLFVVKCQNQANDKQVEV